MDEIRQIRAQTGASPAHSVRALARTGSVEKAVERLLDIRAKAKKSDGTMQVALKGELRTAEGGVVWLQDGDHLASIDLATGTVEKIETPATSAAWSPDGRRLYLCVGRSVEIWDTASLTRISRTPPLPGQRASSVRASPDGARIAATSDACAIFLFEADGTFLRSIGPKEPLVPIEIPEELPEALEAIREAFEETSERVEALGGWETIEEMKSELGSAFRGEPTFVSFDEEAIAEPLDEEIAEGEFGEGEGSEDPAEVTDEEEALDEEEEPEGARGLRASTPEALACRASVEALCEQIRAVAPADRSLLGEILRGWEIYVWPESELYDTALYRFDPQGRIVTGSGIWDLQGERVRELPGQVYLSEDGAYAVIRDWSRGDVLEHTSLAGEGARRVRWPSSHAPDSFTSWLVGERVIWALSEDSLACSVVGGGVLCCNLAKKGTRRFSDDGAYVVEEKRTKLAWQGREAFLQGQLSEQDREALQRLLTAEILPPAKLPEPTLRVPLKEGVSYLILRGKTAWVTFDGAPPWAVDTDSGEILKTTADGDGPWLGASLSADRERVYLCSGHRVEIYTREGSFVAKTPEMPSVALSVDASVDSEHFIAYDGSSPAVFVFRRDGRFERALGPTEEPLMEDLEVDTEEIFEAWGEYEEAAARYSHVGATDTEPETALHEAIRDAIGGQAFQGAAWSLFEDDDDHSEAVEALDAAAEKICALIAGRPLRERMALRRQLAGSLWRVDLPWRPESAFVNVRFARLLTDGRRVISNAGIWDLSDGSRRALPSVADMHTATPDGRFAAVRRGEDRYDALLPISFLGATVGNRPHFDDPQVIVLDTTSGESAPTGIGIEGDADHLWLSPDGGELWLVGPERVVSWRRGEGGVERTVLFEGYSHMRLADGHVFAISSDHALCAWPLSDLAALPGRAL